MIVLIIFENHQYLLWKKNEFKPIYEKERERKEMHKKISFVRDKIEELVSEIQKVVVGQQKS